MLIYGVLLIPWPGWHKLYGQFYQGMGNTAFGNATEKLYLFCGPNFEKVWPRNFDTLVTMANRDRLDAQGKGPLIRLGLDSWQMGWIPTALSISLPLATPIRWPRRVSALFWSVCLTQCFVFLSLGFFIWNESTRISLLTLAPLWKALTDAIETDVTAPVGVPLFVPVLIWILVTFRSKDGELIRALN